MYKHHKTCMEKIVEIMEKDEEVLGILLGGSIAHKRERKDSDLDIMIIVGEDDFNSRRRELKTWYLKRFEIDDGEVVVDGKYISIDYIRKVKTKGNEATKYAMEDALILYSKIDGLESIIQEATSYPRTDKQERLNRFFAQFMGWYWYYQQSLRRKDIYLTHTAISKMIFFSGRMVLADNEVLYPYHKWFMKTLTNIVDKPDNMMNLIKNIYENPSQNNVEEFFESVKSYKNWSTSTTAWPNLVAKDSELVWLNGEPLVDDL